jgi:hypothetical protein
MEIETPPMKGDLVRMHDAYGRQHTGYEKTNEYSTDFAAYEYFPFEEKDYKGWRFKSIEIMLCKERPAAAENTLMIVPINGIARSKSNKIIDVGEAYAISASELENDSIDHKDYQFLVFNRI